MSALATVAVSRRVEHDDLLRRLEQLVHALRVHARRKGHFPARSTFRLAIFDSLKRLLQIFIFQQSQSHAVAFGQGESDAGILVRGFQCPGDVGSGLQNAFIAETVPETTSGLFAAFSVCAISFASVGVLQVNHLPLALADRMACATANPRRAISSGAG